MAPLDLTALSRTVSHALRHEPWLYELELDEHGWVPVAALLAALRGGIPAGPAITRDDLATMIARSDKTRHEIEGERIRALYGHSTPHRLMKTPAPPPALLFHGTTAAAASSIRQTGLKPMGRQYVHLSTDLATAEQVGRRKAAAPVILRVRADAAHAAGLRFYRGNDKVWLADEIAPDYVDEQQ